MVPHFHGTFHTLQLDNDCVKDFVKKNFMYTFFHLCVGLAGSLHVKVLGEICESEVLSLLDNRWLTAQVSDFELKFYGHINNYY